MTGDQATEFLYPGLSHVKGRSSEPLLDLSIPALLRQTAETFPQNEAVVFPEQGIRWNYSDLSLEIDRLARGFLELGIERGDRVGIWSPNRFEWLLTQFATARIGAILVCVNPAYRTSELEYALNKVSCKALVTAERFKSSDYIGMLRALAPELETCRPGNLSSARLPHLSTVISLGALAQSGMFGFENVRTLGDGGIGKDLDELSRALSADDPINIQFTSGTTGSPKGACLTHRNIVNNAKFVTARLEFTDRDRLCVPVPFYHCFGMVMGVLGCVTKGATIVVPGEAFDPLGTLKAVATERCSALYGVPTMFLAMLESPRFHEFDLSSLRTGIMAGSLCPIEIMKRVQSEMHMAGVTIAYGMTETSPVSFQSNVDDPLDKRVSSVGRIHPHVEVRIVDKAGTTVPVGSSGELLTRGYSVMKEYWNDPELTARSIDADGWMHTGDLATLDEHGYCEVTGRSKDMIIRGGENVSPREVEDFLFTHPNVALAQVFGVPDAMFGEIVCAWVVAKEGAELTEDHIRDFCKDQIAHFKIPAHVRIRSDLPMTVTGKPQKYLMRDAMISELGLAPQAAGTNTTGRKDSS